MTLARPEVADLLPARADTDSWTSVVREVTILAQQIAGTEFVPRGIRNSVPATAAAILYGREVGLPPMTALSQIHVVEGRPGMSAEAMRALVLAAGHEIEFDETTGAVCRLRGRRRFSETWTVVEWTIDHARQAGLLRRGSAWESYPRDMLIARATTALCRMLFPDVIHGFRSTEELDDMGEPTTSTTRSRRTTNATTATKVSRRKPAADPTEETASSPAPGSSEASPRRTTSLPGEDRPEEEPVESSAPVAPPPDDEPLPIEVPKVDPAYPAAGEVPTYSAPPPVPTDEPDEPPINAVTLKLVFGQLRRLGLDDDEQGREERLGLLARITGRAKLSTAKDLTQTEGAAIATVLSTARDREALDEILAVATLSKIATPVDEPPPPGGPDYPIGGEA